MPWSPKRITKTDIHIYILIISQCMLCLPWFEMYCTITKLFIIHFSPSSAASSFLGPIILLIPLSSNMLSIWLSTYYVGPSLTSIQNFTEQIRSWFQVSAAVHMRFYALLGCYASWLGVCYLLLGKPVSPIIKGQAPRPLKMEMTGYPERSVTTNQRCITSQRSEYLKHSLSLESNTSTFGQEISWVLWNLKFITVFTTARNFLFLSSLKMRWKREPQNFISFLQYYAMS